MNEKTVTAIKEQIEKLGNSAHETRNVVFCSFSDQIPETLVINDELSRIEGICLDIMRTKLNFTYLSYFEFWKVALRRIKRHIRFCSKVVKLSSDGGYEAFSAKFKEQIQQHLDLQLKIADNVDNYLNKLFIEFTESANSSSAFSYTDTVEDSLLESLDYSKINEPQFNELTTIQLALKAAKDACNLAHNIQNAVCCYQVIDGFKDQANYIKDSSGEIENMFRDIQRELYQNNHSLKDLASIIKEKAEYSSSKLPNILENLKTLSKHNLFKKTEDVQFASNRIIKCCEFFSESNNIMQMQIVA